MAETMCLPTGTAKASKPHSQPAQKYPENSGFALVVKSAPARQAGSVSSLLGVLHVASWHETDMPLQSPHVRCWGINGRDWGRGSKSESDQLGHGELLVEAEITKKS